MSHVLSPPADAVQANWPWTESKHRVLIGDELYQFTPLQRTHLVRWGSGEHERLQEVPISMAAMRFPAIVAFPGLVENLFDDHLRDGSVRPWQGGLDYGQDIALESDLAGVISVCTRLVLRDKWPGSSMRRRASDLALDWAEDPGLIPQVSLPGRCVADQTWHQRVLITASARLLNGRVEGNLSGNREGIAHTSRDDATGGLDHAAAVKRGLK